MSRLTIVEGNSNDKDNVRAIMVKGEPGDDGISPTATVSKTEGVATLTVTDAQGTTTTTIRDGYDGRDATGGVPTSGVIGFEGEIADMPDGYEVFDGLNSAYCFNNVDEMKVANLIEGDFVNTAGYYSANDGGGAKYKIRTKTNADTPNEMDLIAIGLSLVGELITNGEVNIKQLGAKGDGLTDNTQIIQYAINNYSNILLLNENYLVTNSIVINNSNKNILGKSKSSTITYNGDDSSDFIIKISENAKKVNISNIYFNGNNKINGICNGYEQNINVSNRSYINNIYLENVKNGINCYCFGSNFENIFINNVLNNGININGTDSFYTNIRVYNAQNYGINCVSSSNRLINVKCAVCKTGFYFNADNIEAIIESQENLEDNIILDRVVTSNFIINSNGANCKDLEEEVVPSDILYGLIKMKYCREVNVNGTIIAHPTFLVRKAYEKYGLKMEKTNINNNIDLTYQNRDTSIQRTIPSLISSNIFNNIKINGLNAELYNAKKLEQPTFNGTSRSTLSNVTYTSLDATISSIPDSKNVNMFSVAVGEDYTLLSIGLSMPKLIETGFIQYQYEANGTNHNFNLLQSERRLSFDSNDYNKILFTYENLQELLMNNAEYAAYIASQTPITNRKIFVALNLTNYSDNDVIHLKDIEINYNN